MPSIGTITIKGKSGASYDFQIFPIPVNFNALSGLYLFTIKDGIHHSYVYLGRTENLSTRFDNHHKQEDISKAGANHLSVCRLPTCDLEEAEKDIMANIKTLCNDHLN